MPPTFAQLGVPKSICHALARRGITQPFEIQRARDGRCVERP